MVDMGMYLISVGMGRLWIAGDNAIAVSLPQLIPIKNDLERP